MVKASIVTVKLFVCIFVNFLPPELYLKDAKEHHCTPLKSENHAKNRHQMPQEWVLLEEYTQVCNESAYQ